MGTFSSVATKSRKLRSPQSGGRALARPDASRRAFMLAVRSLEEVESPAAMRFLTETVSQALPNINKLERKRPTLSGAELEWNALKRAFEFRRAILADSVPTAQVAELQNVTRQAVSEKARKGQLLGILEAGQLWFPIWQFDPTAQGGVLPGLGQVLRALDSQGPTPALGKAAWFQKPNPSLGGGTPVDALRQGRLKEVLATAGAVGVA